MERNIESKVAAAILQQPMEVTVGEQVYQVAPPSVATLILASEAAGRMPQISLNPEKIIDETLSVAKYCRPMGEFVAILILGAKCLKEEHTKEIEEERERRVFGFRCGYKKVRRRERVDIKRALADRLLEELSPRELYELTARLLQQMQIGDFFGISTFLIETNLLRPKKVEETTAYGR